MVRMASWQVVSPEHAGLAQRKRLSQSPIATPVDVAR